MDHLAPSSDNLYVGAGSVYFDRFDANGLSTGLRHMGNADTMELTNTADKKEKKNAMDGTKATYAEVTVGTASEISIALSEFTKENLALSLMGNVSALVQAANAAVADQPVGPVAVNVMLDVWYDLGVLNPIVTTIKQGAAALNAAAYEVNAEAGMFRLLSSYVGAGKATAATAITWSGSIPAIDAEDGRHVIQGLTDGNIKGRLRYISADNQSSGPRLMVDVWVVGLNPDGALSLIGEDFANMTLKGKVYADTTKPVGQRYFRAIYL